MLSLKTQIAIDFVAKDVLFIAGFARQAEGAAEMDALQMMCRSSLGIHVLSSSSEEQLP